MEGKENIEPQLGFTFDQIKQNVVPERKYGKDRLTSNGPEEMKKAEESKVAEEIKIAPLTIKNKYKNIPDYFVSCLIEMTKRDQEADKLKNETKVFEDIKYKTLKSNRVRTRLLLQYIPKKIQNMKPYQVLEITIETENNDSLKKYVGYGVVSHVI